MIKIDNVSYSYETEENEIKLVLDKVSLEIPKGQFVSIIGHNGSGKSTLAKHLNGILLPCGGKVYVNGIDTSVEKTVWDVRSDVGMVFQNPDNQMVSTIVEDDVAFAPENLGYSHDEIVARVEWALKAVGMYKMRSYAPHMLSGGQKQRVAIAGVLAMKPEYIVLDEPTAMLDPKGRREVLDAIHKLNREEGITIVLITHYMSEAADSDRIVVMNDGKVMMDDVPEKIFERVEELKEVGLDVPQVTELMYELREEGIDVLNAINVEDAAEEIAKILG